MKFRRSVPFALVPLAALSLALLWFFADPASRGAGPVDEGRLGTDPAAGEEPVMDATLTGHPGTTGAGSAAADSSVRAPDQDPLSSSGSSAAQGTTKPAEKRSPPHRLWPDARTLSVEQWPLPERPGEVYRVTIVEPADLPYPIRIEELLRISEDTGELRPIHVQREVVADHLLVGLRDEATPDSLKAVLAPFGATVKERIHNSETHVVRVPRFTEVKVLPQVLAALKAAQGVTVYAEYDNILRPQQVEPNDPSYLNGTLWGMNNTGQNNGVNDIDGDLPEAWQIRNRASNVVVGVIDSGIRVTHEDLVGNLWRNPGEIAGDGVDNDNNGYVDDIHGIDAITNTGNLIDDNGHGTHVAGTVGAVGNNGVGVSGVAWSIQLMGARFLGQNGGATSDAIEAIAYCREMGADLTNNSWGGGAFSTALRNEIADDDAAGLIFVAAAGNESRNIDINFSYPAGYDLPNIVSVAAHDRQGRLANFSNYGRNNVDIAAPGVEIFSAWIDNDSAYRSIQGTSMASPYVAGMVALLRTHFPNENHLETIERLYVGAITEPAFEDRMTTGGRVNLFNSLSVANIEGLPRITAGVPDQAVAAGGSITLSVQATGQAPLSYAWRKDGQLLPNARDASLIVNNASAADSGIYTVTVSNAVGEVTSSGQLTVSVSSAELANAIDAPGRVFLTDGDAPWGTSSEVIFAGESAAVSGRVGDEQTSRLSTTVMAPGVLSFRFRTDTEPTSTLFGIFEIIGDEFIFSIDGQPALRESGVSSWLEVTVSLEGAGPRELDFALVRNAVSDDAAYAGRVWLDAFSFSPNGVAPPRIEEQPSPIAVAVGEDASFTVTATGQDLAYVWTRDDDPVPGTGATLQLNDVTLADAGSYRVTITNSAGEVTSAPVELRVTNSTEAPQIITPPQDQTAPEGGAISFSVDVSGTEPLAFAWQRDGITLPLAHSRTLTLTDLEAADAGDYQVRVSNAAGQVTSEAATLTVLGGGGVAPQIVVPPADTEVAQGGEALLRVEAQGNPPLAYEWTFAGNLIPDSNTATLAISPAQPGDAGDYQVTVSNAVGRSMAATARVVVRLPAPELGDALDAPGRPWETSVSGSWFFQDFETRDGVDAASIGPAHAGDPQVDFIATEVSGPGTLSWSWRMAGRNQIDSLTLTVNGAVQERISGDVPWQTRTLELGPGPQQLRWAFATADGQPAPGQNSSATIDEFSFIPTGVAELPFISRQPEDRNVAAVGSVALSVEARGTAPLQYQWFRGLPGAETAIPGADRPNLPFDPVSHGDAGSYFVRVSNAAGTVESRVAELGIFTPGEFYEETLLASGTDPAAFRNWSGGGDAPWGPSSERPFAGASLRSGSIGNSQSSEFQFELTGPVTLSFWWSLSSEVGFDVLRVFRDGAEVGVLGSGERDYQPFSVAVPEGSHMIRFAYEKDSSVAAGLDAAFVDQFTLVPNSSGLADAIDAANRSVLTEGSAPWLADDPGGGLNIKGPDSALTETGLLPGQTSRLFLEVETTEPSVVRFDWALLETPADPGVLEFEIGEVDQVLHLDNLGGNENFLGQAAFNYETANSLWPVQVALPAGNHILGWNYRESDGTAGRAVIDAFEIVPAPNLEALRDSANAILRSGDLDWYSYGDAPWTAQGDHLQSGPIGDSQASYLQTKFSGPARVTYDWDASTEASGSTSGTVFDALLLYFNGILLDAQFGKADRRQGRFFLTDEDFTTTFVYRKDASISENEDLGRLFGFEVEPLTGLYNATVESDFIEWGFLASGLKAWDRTAAISSQGGDALEIRNLEDSEFSVIAATVSGPGTLSFDWRVSSELGFDFLSFHLNEIPQERISGTAADGEDVFRELSVELPPGEHLALWIYEKDGSVSSGEDAAWLDNVTLEKAPSPYEKALATELGAAWSDLPGTAPEEDFDGDSVANFVEILLGRSVATAEEASPYSQALVEIGAKTYLTVEFSVLRDVLPVTILGRSTGPNGLGNWARGDGATEITRTVDPTDRQRDLVVVRDRIAIEEQPQRFLSVAFEFDDNAYSKNTANLQDMNEKAGSMSQIAASLLSHKRRLDTELQTWLGPTVGIVAGD